MSEERLTLKQRLREESLGWGLGPAALCQEAEEALHYLEAENARLREALTGVRVKAEFYEQDGIHKYLRHEALRQIAASARAALEQE